MLPKQVYEAPRLEQILDNLLHHTDKDGTPSRKNLINDAMASYFYRWWCSAHFMDKRFLSIWSSSPAQSMPIPFLQSFCSFFTYHHNSAEQIDCDHSKILGM
ncbi:hypothetical protein BpHYR1_015612 [Brachionus plicatilis]|uniref:Uncharacterized protein n=1 Tax=Brachionus plicatilis TaxID=10195 RepID=A0A3M7PRS4_BRAPC|nr:hypothetical protein BpHYR1_015612 [Brachionus plicatilis]